MKLFFWDPSQLFVFIFFHFFCKTKKKHKKNKWSDIEITCTFVIVPMSLVLPRFTHTTHKPKPDEMDSIKKNIIYLFMWLGLAQIMPNDENTTVHQTVQQVQCSGTPINNKSETPLLSSWRHQCDTWIIGIYIERIANEIDVLDDRTEAESIINLNIQIRPMSY